MICEYCEGKEKLMHATPDPDYGDLFRTGIDLEIMSGTLIADAPRYDYKEIDIHYCPMCGERLQEVE